MDIRSFTRKDTATVPIQDPLGGKTDIVVEVYGRDSKTYRKGRLSLPATLTPPTKPRRQSVALSCCNHV